MLCELRKTPDELREWLCRQYSKCWSHDQVRAMTVNVLPKVMQYWSCPTEQKAKRVLGIRVGWTVEREPTEWERQLVFFSALGYARDAHNRIGVEL